MARGGLSFDGIGNQQVTMLAGTKLKALVEADNRDSVVGLPIVVSGNDEVDLGTDKDTIFGFIDAYENDGYVSVQYRGFREDVVTVGATSAVGKCVATDASGKVKASDSLEKVRAPIFTKVDTVEKTATVFLG